MSAPESISRALSRSLGALRFKSPTAYVYNPLDYAWETHRAYLRRWGAGRREVLFLGMNPGPWGMAQTGVPFGEVSLVRDWLGISGRVRRPEREHPKRPVLGLDCPRSEVSGARLWGWARERFGAPERFFERFLVLNYCPLMFMEASGKNRTPDALPISEREPLEDACDAALARLVDHYRTRMVVGIGAFAMSRAREALAGRGVRVETILHPSPASPAANRGWAGQAEARLRALGLL